MLKHGTDGSEFYHSFCGGWQPFIAFRQTSVGILPGKGPLYYPALRHGLKALFCYWPFDNLQLIACQFRLRFGGSVFGWQIAAIGKDLLYASPLIITA